MNLLKRIDNSVLWLLDNNNTATSNLTKCANSLGINPNRLIFAKRNSHEKYLAQFRQADLYLDTFLCNAGSTSTNALWAGLPVLTKLGKGYATRIAGSFLNSLKMNELITSTEEEYEELAYYLATNPKKLSQIKQKLYKNRISKPLFNSKLFTQHLESGYEIAYNRYSLGKKPKTIYVPK